MKLINGDCFEVIETLSDKSIDLVLTDPPYLIEQTRGAGCLNKVMDFQGSLEDLKKNTDITKGYDIERFASLITPKMKNINIYFWCNKKQIPQYLESWVTKRKCAFEILLWHKTNVVPAYSTHYKIDTEYCLYFHKNGGCHPKCSEDASTYYISASLASEKKRWGHPTIKPLPFIERLVKNSSNEGDTVLDPFMGSGTTGVACKNLGRDFIGIEVDDTYYSTARERIYGNYEDCVR